MDVQGKTVAVTGKFNKIQRKEIELELAKRGAKIAKSVTGKTEILIAGERAGSKLAKAKSMGILIVDEKALLAVLAQEATVEVEAPKPKAVDLPESYNSEEVLQRAKKLFNNKIICSTGKLRSLKRAQLKALVEASGGKMIPSPKAGMDIMISGLKWGNKLRDAIYYKAAIYTEGELLLALEGNKNFPQEADVPNGANLSKLDVLKEGEAKLNTPSGFDGELVLKWKKVAFKPHMRFLELYGFEFDKKDHQFVGKLYYNGEELQPGALFWTGYGCESWNRHHFWECGSDTHTDQLEYDGKNGFNCTPFDLRRKKIHVNWKAREQDGQTVWIYETDGESTWYGDVCSDSPNMWLMVDLTRKLYGFNYHTHPYIIREDDPYARN